MTVVVGTAGHIDHGKTALLRALTGIDADRLPEERRRGMTIDVGYAHLALPDGDRARLRRRARATTGWSATCWSGPARSTRRCSSWPPTTARAPRPSSTSSSSTRWACATGSRSSPRPTWSTPRPGRRGPRRGRATAGRDRARRLAGARRLVGRRSRDGRRPAALVDLRDRALGSAGRPARHRAARSRLAIDRVFTVKGRGLVVTGTLRGGPLARNAILRLVPGDRDVRARELQVHGRAVERAGPGRTAVNLAGVDALRAASGARPDRRSRGRARPTGCSSG